MAVTTTSALNGSTQALYLKDYMMATTGAEFFDQLCEVRKAMNGERGATVDWVIYEGMDVATSTLTEASDITPVAMSDSAAQITVSEYGNGIQQTALLKATAYTDVGKAAAQSLGINRARSMDIVVRDVAVAGTNVVRVKNVTARTSLTETNHLLDYATLIGAVARARAHNIPAGPDGNYTAVVHPLVVAELTQIPQWQSYTEYQDKSELFDGEVGQLAGIRFVQSYNAKIYLGGGSTAQAATTTGVNSAIAAGDTSITLTANAGLAAGDFIVVGTLEAATAELVQITAINASALTATISGIGNTQSNFGFRYAHAANAAVTEAANVGCMVLQGPRSIGKVYSDITGPKGDLRITGPFDAIGRFLNFSWYFVGGYGIVSQKWLLRLEFAMANKIPMANQY